MFGRRALGPRDWKPVRPGSVADEVGRAAAQMQHEVARRVRARRGGMTVAEVHAEGMDLSLDRLRKVLRGAAPMTLRQLADLSRVLGELFEGLGP